MDWVWPLLAAPFVGSFIGVLIRRLSAGGRAALSRSACNHCGSALAAYDHVKLLSYATLRGHCRRSDAAIIPFHWLVEAAATLMAAIGAWVGLPTVLLGAALTWLLWALWLRLRGAELTATTALPFGPFSSLVSSLAGCILLLLD